MSIVKNLIYFGYEIYRFLSDQNDSYEMTINSFQVRKTNEIKKRNFPPPLWETSLSVKAEVWMFIKSSA